MRTCEIQRLFIFNCLFTALLIKIIGKVIMGDSDDEYDRRRGRDKFRRERSDYQERRDDRNRRDDWNDREAWSGNRDNRNSGGRRGGDYNRDYRDNNRRDRYSPARHEMSPPAMKRVRRDWDDRSYMNSSYDNSYGNHMTSGPRDWSHDNSGNAAHGSHFREDQGPTQPPMMSFKQFLTSQDDAIDDQEAVKKYSEYKLEFCRQQLNEFFLNHKEEEWFKLKYHPEDSTKKHAEQCEALKIRLAVFLEMIESDLMKNVTLDVDNTDEIIKFLDAVVIKLEGGSDFDLKSLDMPIEEKKPEALPKTENGEETARKHESEVEKEEKVNTEEDKNSKKRKRGRGYDSDEDSGSESESGEESDGEITKPDKEEPIEKKPEDEPNPDIEEKSEVDPEVKEPEPSENPEETIAEESAEIKEETEENKEEKIEEPEVPRPKPLHRTCSIFLRNLAPTITKQEVEAMCRRFPGFLRAAIADPISERRFFRRGWVTFERSVNIKEICWNLNNIRLRECELGAIVNRDLSRRVRNVGGITSHKQVARADIKLAAKIIQNLDDKQNLWKEENNAGSNSVEGFGLVSKNPLLKNITDYLIEEASAEEEELLGNAEDLDKEKDGEASIERDDSLLKVLDRLILYLRIVHSFDYYNISEYPAEDEMPNRCGIIHARGSPPVGKVIQQEINDFVAQFERKIGPFLVPYTKLSEEEAVKLGKKNSEIEVEKFIKVNTQELAKDKWLCPLSGKKFKGPSFVRKHIQNKHGEKVDEVKLEVEYFNNYLIDRKRPQLPEHPGNLRGSSGTGSHDNHPYQGAGAQQGAGHNRPGYQGGRQGFQARNSYNDPYGRAGFNQKRSYSNMRDHNRRAGGRQNMSSRNDPREIVGYHDLDAPQDVDFL